MLNETKAHFHPPITLLMLRAPVGKGLARQCRCLALARGAGMGRGAQGAGGPSCPCGGLQSTLVLSVLTPALVPCRSGNVFTKSSLLREQTRSGFCQKARAFLGSSEFPFLKASSQEGKHVLTKN